MLTFRRRWQLALTVTVILGSCFLLLENRIRESLGHVSYFSGGTLLGCIVLLMALGLKKRLVMLPLLSTATWTQIHIYTGLFAGIAYLAHVPTVIANGVFEGGLSWLFLVVSLSGVYGIYVSRTAPKKLTSVPGEFRFDQIPWHRQMISDRATEVLRTLDASLASPVLAGYFRNHLQPYFSGGVAVDYLLVPHSLRRRRLLLGLTDLERYLTPEIRQASGKLAALVRKRDELDLHYVLQLRLRTWIGVHLIASLLLVAWTMMHLLLVFHFV
jgi:hypothetical protein